MSLASFDISAIFSFKDAIVDLAKDSKTGAPAQLFVPAVEITMEFTETKILTQVDAAAGF